MATTLLTARECLNNTLNDESRPWAYYFGMVEDATGIKRIVLFVGSLMLFVWWLLFGISDKLLSVLLGIMYPVFCSMLAIQAPRTESEATNWLMYWVVFGLFCFLEFVIEHCVDTIPYYAPIKCIILIWLMVPGDYNGSRLIYNFLVKYVIKLDQNK